MKLRSASVVLVTSLALAAVAVVPAGCSRGEARRTLTISGSTTLLTMTEAAGQLYRKTHPGVRVMVQGGGSSAGIEEVAKGASEIGMSSRDLAEEEKGLGLVDHVVAIDAICIIVNPANPVSGVTTEQARAIFQGKTTNWKAIGGPDEPIGLVNRDEASGTREAFWKKILDKQPFDRHAVVLPGTGQVRSVVANSPGAVGYISVGFLTDEVKALRLSRVTPTRENVEAKRYGLARKLHFFTKGEAKGLAKDFIDFVMSPKVQKEIVSVEFIPVT